LGGWFAFGPRRCCRAATVATVFEDEWVRVSGSKVVCGSALYRVSSITGVRVATIRDAAIGHVISSVALLVALDYAVCAAAFESFRSVPFVALALATLSFSWARWWSPEWFLVVVGVSGQEVTLVRYRSKSAALACLEGIQEAIALAETKNRP
jgi:hypothetical protein